MKQYRIGDFAKYLGVTPDLLKHYEDMGIIQSQRSESGYRYYPFHTTTLLIESIRLRNYGFTLREIQEVLQAHSVDNARMEALLAGNTHRLEQEIQLDEALLEDYRDFQVWKQPLEKRDWDWEIRWSVPMCFLPHTDRDDFLQDPRIYEILNPWMSFIPIVKSAMRVEIDGQLTWGFLAREQDVQRLHEFGDWIRRSFTRNLLQQYSISCHASSVAPGSQPEYALTSDSEAFWMAEEEQAVFTADWHVMERVTHIVLSENIRCSQRIEQFCIDLLTEHGWKEIAAHETVGYKYICPVASVSASAVRIRIHKSRLAPTLSFVGVYSDCTL